MTCHAYVFPCLWEDHCKIGFSHDPLARITQLHGRWFEVFDLQAGFLVEVEREREARDLELHLRRPLRAHRAPRPLTIRDAAGGHTEWVRGAQERLHAAAQALNAQGHIVHAPLVDWMHASLLARAGHLYDWAEAQLGDDPQAAMLAPGACHRTLRDAIDAYLALGIDPEPWLSPKAWAWHGVGSQLPRQGTRHPNAG